jgi:hypothetical protein
VKNQVLRKSLIVSNQYTRRAYDKGRAAALAGLDETTELVKWGNRNYAADWFDDDSRDAWQAGFSDVVPPEIPANPRPVVNLADLRRSSSDVSYLISWVEKDGLFDGFVLAQDLQWHVARILELGFELYSVQRLSVVPASVAPREA